MQIDKSAHTDHLRQAAHRLGFDLVGVCPAVTPAGISRFHEWIKAGYAGQMDYLPQRAGAYEHPRSVLDGVRSLMMLGLRYDSRAAAPAEVGQGRVSCYAWGSVDYHDLIHDRLKSLLACCQRRLPEARARGVVDTAPLLEREFAQLAGLGWVGKNTLLLNPIHGSYFFLAALLIDVELDYDAPHETDHCGTCTACLDACPTDAFPQPYVLDARRCISYLTIELREAIPDSLRAGIGNWVFGCDICQEVCPWNGRSPVASEPELRAAPEQNPLELAPLFELGDEGFRERFRKTPLWRAKRRGLLRNAAMVLGNQASPKSVAPLSIGLIDAEPLVRASCAWALGRVNSTAARVALHARLAPESDPTVTAEIKRALGSETSR